MDFFQNPGNFGGWNMFQYIEGHSQVKSVVTVAIPSFRKRHNCIETSFECLRDKYRTQLDTYTIMTALATPIQQGAVTKSQLDNTCFYVSNERPEFRIAISTLIHTRFSEIYFVPTLPCGILVV
ncbi:MAG TPA: hypothetical protein VNJ01_01740 [Bacteriovoracaceae bacterium]|nr:hypothetical protein [Bacteriovoracaceae bacterium]